MFEELENRDTLTLRTQYREAAALAAFGGGKCNSGSLPSPNNGTHRRSMKKDTKERRVEVVDLGPATAGRREGWIAKFTMDFPK